MSSTPSANSVSSATIVDDSITGSDIANTLSMTDTTLNIGSLTVSAGSFRVDSAGSATVSTFTATGSVTASTLAITGTGHHGHDVRQGRHRHDNACDDAARDRHGDGDRVFGRRLRVDERVVNAERKLSEQRDDRG